ncbi:MAG: DNA mismatch repair protein MutS [Gammaproteobacteria bacterium]|nr:DNA mismatch repair protein MutS [Gammaproteobacteria bacterium]
MTSKIPPVEDEINYFRELMGGVRRIRSDRVLPNHPKPPPHPIQTRKDQAPVMKTLLHSPYDPDDTQAGDTVSYYRPGVKKTILRKLGRGQYSVGAKIDLHGMTAAKAIEALTQFLKRAQHSPSRCVCIIHGKGHRSSDQGPVLKPLVNRWLRERDDVLAFCSARPADGGTGAVYALLRACK